MPHRILVVEDDAPIRELLVALLLEEGYELRAAANGVEALEQLDWQPDLILLDMMMPVMDGPQFRERQLALPAPSREIPVIVVTAGRSADAELAAMHVSGIVWKPFDDTALIQAVESIC